MMENCGDVSMSKYCEIMEEVFKKLQETDIFAKYNLLLLQTSKQRRNCRTFIPEEKFRNMEYTLSHSTYPKNLFIVMLQILWIAEIDSKVIIRVP